MKYLLLLSLICTNFVMGQEYDKGFIARKFEHTGNLTGIFGEFREGILNRHYKKLFCKTLRDGIKPDNLDKKIAKQFYEHIEQCAAFVKNRYDERETPLRKGNKKILKTCLNNHKEDDLISISYKITPESPLYEIVSNKYKEAEKTNKDEPEHSGMGDVILWLTRNTHCNPNDEKIFECRSTFFAKEYMEMIEKFEKKQ